MAHQYTVRAGLTDPSSYDVNSQDPYWLMAVFPYDVVDAFNRNLINSATKDGIRVVNSDSDWQRCDDTQGIIFDHEIAAWQTQHDKDGHVDQLQLNMYNVNANLAMLSSLNAGDWCMFWAFNDKASYDIVRRRLISTYGCRPWTPQSGDDQIVAQRGDTSGVTFWASGLKFVGRLAAPRHHEGRDSDGRIQLAYNVQAFGFTELDSYIYFDDALFFKNPNVIIYMQNLGLPMKDFLRSDGSVNTSTAIPGLVKIFLGTGPGTLSKDIGNTTGHSTSSGPGISASPNIIYSVPGNVLKVLLPQDSQLLNLKYYSDVLQMIVGNQAYRNGGSDPWSQFMPDGTWTNNVLDTGDPLKDYVAPWNLDFKNKSVWDIIMSLLNEPVNECYTALKPDVDGNLLPSLVIRRNPYGTASYQSTPGALKALPFAEYPQWIIPEQLITDWDIGKTDAARVNYVHLVPAVMPSKNPLTNQQLARFFAPPVVNRVDIARNGLRMYEKQVMGFWNPQAKSSGDNQAQEYTNFMADVLMDGHLRYSGALSCAGLQEPICVGDNLLTNNILFHIESVLHAGHRTPDGSKSFTTTLHVSHGIPMNLILIDQDQAAQTQATVGQIQSHPGPPTPDEVQSFRTVLKNADDTTAPAEDAITQARNDRSDLAVGLISSIRSEK